MASASADVESEFVKIADPDTIKIQEILDKLDMKLKDLAFRNKVVDIGQSIRTVNALKNFNGTLDEKEKAIKKSVIALKRLLIPFKNDEPNDTPLPPCEKQSWIQRLSKPKDDYVVYFCELIKNLYKNVDVAEKKKSSINPLGREKGEVPLLIKDYTEPFVLEAKRVSQELPSEDVEETLSMTKDEITLEQGGRLFGGKRKTKRVKQKRGLKRATIKNKRVRRKTKKAMKPKKRAMKTKKN